MRLDREEDVISLLKAEGIWDNREVWRDLGDEPENYSTVGNQQSRAEQALVEKLVNAIDSKLMAAARTANLDPESDAAPSSMAEARDRFFGEQWSDPDTLARGITVVATGDRAPGRMSLSIADDGEGQTPAAMPRTILSVLKGSKKNVQFVQGRFHMGGTGVLEFCSKEHNLQFVVSRRNPALMPVGAAETDLHWSFTIVRREDPQGRARGSRFTFFAAGEPDDEGRAGLLHFSAEGLKLFPERAEAYVREAAWGTLFKLYEYDVRLKGPIILSDSLMHRVRIMLPEPALPIRFHECRKGFRGHTGSFDTTMKGLIPTLDDDRRNEKRTNVEWFDRFEMDVDGERLTGRIYVFKDRKAADNYRRDEGVVFTYNGQTHATFTKDFFRRASVKQDYLWHSLLVFIDCSAVSVRAHERLFMPGRDRLRGSDLTRALEKELEDKLRTHRRLAELAEERRARERAEAPEISDSFRKFLEDMLKRYPALAGLLGPGLKIKNPYKPTLVANEDRPWEGERFPTRFHFKKVPPGACFVRDANLGAQARLAMETDASDDYFSRDEEAGTFELLIIRQGESVPATNWASPSLSKGTANFTLSLPADVNEGDEIEYEARITDPSRIEPFRCPFRLVVHPARVDKPPVPTPTPLPTPPSEKPGIDHSQSSLLGIPNPTEVYEQGWAEHEFDRSTAVVIKAAPNTAEGQVAYDYYINMDNVHLATAIRAKPKKQHQMRRQFKLGMTILALAIIQQSLASGRPTIAAEGEDEDENREWNAADQVSLFTAAMAPFLIPMVGSLSNLSDDEESLSASAGEAA
ncbi:MAG: hypothetical protein APF82_00385 [Sphingomonadales bacterium BRH_c42]|nr:MAG: hypothetical protein APF82_00385 [Sphingomonadales bacterium BRH_c42]